MSNVLKPENVVTSLTQWFALLQLALLSDKPNGGSSSTTTSTSTSTTNLDSRKHSISKLPFPVLIVGNKYDKFQNEER